MRKPDTVVDCAEAALTSENRMLIFTNLTQLHVKKKRRPHFITFSNYRIFGTLNIMSVTTT